MATKTYSPQEITRVLSISEQRQSQLRNGNAYVTTDGRRNFSTPFLTENVDYKWEKGKVKYTERGFQKLKKRAKTLELAGNKNS